MPRGRNDYETAQIQGRLWTPAVLRPAAWFDAADLSTITIATGVSEWRDKSGNGRNVSQGTAGSQPAYSETGFFGRPAITFDGGDQLDSAASITTGTYSGYFNTVYLATKTATDGGNVFGDRSSSNTLMVGWWTISGTTYIDSDGINTSSNQTISSTDAAKLGSAGGIVVQEHVSGSINNLRLNGSNITVTAGTATSLTGGTAKFSVGNRADVYSPNTPWNGAICELLVCLSAFDFPTRAALEGYLAWKWGLTNLLAADHPFANRPPLIGD